jgi:hypothetical protein
MASVLSICVRSKARSNEWGAIGMGLGLSRAMDYFETRQTLTENCLTGASGWARQYCGRCQGQRFAMVTLVYRVEGAALSRRNLEKLLHILLIHRATFISLPQTITVLVTKVDQLPVDGQYVSLIAPRPLLLQTGSTDYWSDPKGEFLAALAAEPVYKLFGKKGPGTAVFPAAGDTALLNTLGYYMHDGPHGVLPSDYDVFITYILKYLVNSDQQ